MTGFVLRGIKLNPAEKWCQTQGPGDTSGPAKTLIWLAG